MNTSLKKHALLITALLIAAGAATARADSLAVIPTLTGDAVNTALAITPDGQYIVGMSGGTAETMTTRGFLYQVGAPSAINVTAGGAQATIANGVGYRTSGGNTEIIIAGKSQPSGYTYTVVTEYMSLDGTTLATSRRRSASWAYNNMGAANQLGSKTGSDAYYVSSSGGLNQPVYVGQGAGPWVATVTYNNKGISGDMYANMNGVAASGRAVGWRGTGTSASQNYLGTYVSPSLGAMYFKGLAGDNYGQAFAVSADGNTVFGQSPIAAGNVGPRYGYVTTFSGAAENGTVQGPVIGLSLFGDEAGSTSLQVPYGCTADGNFAVGMAYRGQEKAVLWSTKDDWSFALDLTDYASANSLLDGFSRLNRAYSIGGNADGSGNINLVITGTGTWSPDGGVTPYDTRAFVMTVMIPEPGTVTLLALGLFGLLALRRRK